MTTRSLLHRCSLAILLATVALAGCNRREPRAIQRNLVLPPVDPTWAPREVAAVRGVPATAVRGAIEQRLEKARPRPLSADAWTHVRALYTEYDNSPLWLADGGLRNARTAALLRELAGAEAEALQLSSYPLDALEQAISTVRGPRVPTPEQLANADILLTAAYAALGSDLLTGQVKPDSVSADWHIDPREESVDSALVAVIRTEDLSKAIAQLRPQEPDYAALTAQVQRMRALVRAGGWDSVPAGKSLKPGDIDSPVRLNALYDRLRAEGLLDTSAPRPIGPPPPPVTADSTRPSAAATRADGVVYDDVLAGAVARFQATHSITVDSVLGPETVASLNVPAEYRLGQVAANLERYRWLPRALGGRYILVNVPAFHLVAYEEGAPSLEMKVVVGADFEDRKTPVFADSMEHVVFRPYWNVTPDIQAKEIAPKIAEEPGYMERNNLEYWREGPYTRIRQKPGPKNSLGLVKFMFPNSFNIYLHDTPERGLFERDVRAFSHGCIRVERPGELAQWVLGWPADSVEAAMEDGRDNRTVRLKKKIPVFIVYFTAFTVNGDLRFGNDLYANDARLVEALRESALPGAAAVEAATALRRLADQLGE